MALQGDYIYTGYLPNVGMVRVFQDLDSTVCVFAISKAGERHYVARTRIAARKIAKKTVPQVEVSFSQPTLF